MKRIILTVAFIVAFISLAAYLHSLPPTTLTFSKPTPPKVVEDVVLRVDSRANPDLNNGQHGLIAYDAYNVMRFIRVDKGSMLDQMPLPKTIRVRTVGNERIVTPL